MTATSRLAPLSGLLGIVLLVVGWFWDPAAPLDLPDDRLAAWYASHGNGTWLVAAALITASGPCFWAFATYLGRRLAAAGGSERAQRVLAGAGHAFALVVGVFGPIYAAIPLTRVLTRAGDPSAAVSRFVGAAEFSLYVAFTTLTAVAFVVAVGITGWSTRAVPRWLAVAGFPLALIMLASAVLPMEGITLWFLIASVTLAVRPLRRNVVPAPSAAPLPTAVVAK